MLEILNYKTGENERKKLLFAMRINDDSRVNKNSFDVPNMMGF